MRKHLFSAGVVAALLALAGCATPAGTGTPPPATAANAPSSETLATAPVPAADASEPAETDSSSPQGTLVRFASRNTTVEVTIVPDNPTAKDFLALLPLTMSLEEFAGKEKIGTLSRDLQTAGSPGSDPEDGDLIYFIPWGNIGFYYNTDGIGYSDQVIHLGTYNATLDQLTRLEGSTVSVEIAK